RVVLYGAQPPPSTSHLRTRLVPLVSLKVVPASLPSLLTPFSTPTQQARHFSLPVPPPSTLVQLPSFRPLATSTTFPSTAQQTSPSLPLPQHSLPTTIRLAGRTISRQILVSLRARHGDSF